VARYDRGALFDEPPVPGRCDRLGLGGARRQERALFGARVAGHERLGHGPNYCAPALSYQARLCTPSMWTTATVRAGRPLTRRRDTRVERHPSAREAEPAGTSAEVRTRLPSGRTATRSVICSGTPAS